jgi:hypothetical protein
MDGAILAIASSPKRLPKGLSPELGNGPAGAGGLDQWVTTGHRSG